MRSRLCLAVACLSLLPPLGLLPACSSRKAAAGADGGSPAALAPSGPTGPSGPAVAAISSGPAPAAATRAAKANWPLWRYETLAAGARALLPADARVADLSVDPRGQHVAVLVERGPAHRELYLWDGKGPLRPVAEASLAGRELTSVAHSPFTRALYVTSGGGGTWRIDRFSVDAAARALASGANVFRGSARLEALRTAYARYDGFERLYFAQEYGPGRFQILSARSDGSARYELSSPSGEAGPLTDEALRKGASPGTDAEHQRPMILRADSAIPLAVEPHDGTLLVSLGESQLVALAYDGNWGKPRPLATPAPGSRLVPSPNGYHRYRWTPGRPGVEVLDPAGAVADTLERGRVFAAPPVFSPSGRTFVAAVADAGGARLETFAVQTPLAAVRYLSELRPDAVVLAGLAKDGIVHTRTREEQLYGPYERLRYDLCHTQVQVPIFASIDGFLEVLHAGFRAVFLLGEEHLARPRLKTFLDLLQATARKAGRERVARIAEVAAKLLAGDLDHPEGALVRAEVRARSSLHTINTDDIDFQDFHPRGPYATTESLRRYFRAFKYVNLLRVTADELAALQADGALVAAWKAWVDVQALHLAGSRQETWLGGKSTLAPHVRPDCVPARVKAEGPLLYPLSWGIDSEILESSTERLGVAADCAVPGRLSPTGLDLLAGLGSRAAGEALADEYRAMPALRKVHEALARRFAKVGGRGVVQRWLRLVQLLSTETRVPEGVAPRLWRQRLLQTALASWASLRHTTVLVDALGGAECGDSFQGFERLQVEPVRGAVDPLPAQWQAVSELLRTLAVHAVRLDFPEKEGLRKALASAADRARAFGGMAQRQMAGEPLTAAEYAAIQKFAGEVEHPFLLLQSAATNGPEATGVTSPAPMTKIVEIHQAGPSTFVHAAVGHPLAVTVLLGDRGLLTPASGAVYSYYEVTAERRLDDEEWRRRLREGSVKAPAWVPPAGEPLRAGAGKAEGGGAADDVVSE